MGVVIPIAMLAIAAAGTAVSINSAIQAKKAASDQADQALRSNDRQLKMATSTGELQAQQQSSERTRRYNEVLSAQTAMWATRGVQLQSGTVSNIADQSTDAYNRDEHTIELNRLNRLASVALQGADVQYAASNATSAARTRMVGSVAGSLFSFASTAVSGGTKIYDMSNAAGAAGSAGAAAQQPGLY